VSLGSDAQAAYLAFDGCAASPLRGRGQQEVACCSRFRALAGIAVGSWGTALGPVAQGGAGRPGLPQSDLLLRVRVVAEGAEPPQDCFGVPGGVTCGKFSHRWRLWAEATVLRRCIHMILEAGPVLSSDAGRLISPSTGPHHLRRGLGTWRPYGGTARPR
jgi:hypothetical protein